MGLETPLNGQSCRDTIRESSPPVESVEEAIEETFIRLRTDPSYGIRGLVNSVIRRSEEEILAYEVQLSDGNRGLIYFSHSRRKLRRLVSRFRKSRRKLVQSVVVRIGESIARLRTRIANCIHTIYRAMQIKCDPMVERKKQRVRQRRARWIVEKNFQLQFT